MSSSAECWEFSGRRFPEKPSFSQTCSRLSRYLKEKGSFGDLSLGMTCKPDVNGGFAVAASRQPTIMSLFPCEASGTDSSIAEDIKPKNLFPRQSSFSSSSSSGPKEETQNIKEIKSVKSEPQTAPLTIFYGGQVVVFNDFPAEKAKEIIDLANKESAKIKTAYTPNLANNQIEISPNPNKVHISAKTSVQDPIQPPPTSLACAELPIARRASLHRFLEKRKDRITSLAPYQVNGQAEASSKPPPGDNTAWLSSR